MTASGERLVRLGGSAREGASQLKRNTIDVFGTVGASTLFLPGVLGRLGLRWFMGLVLGVKVNAVALHQNFGGIPTLEGKVTPWRQWWVLIGAPLLLIPLGMAFALPAAVDFISLGVWIVPEGASEDELQRALLRVLFVQGFGAFLKLWVAVSCWYGSALVYEDIVTSREGLERLKSRVARGMRSLLYPAQVIGRVVRVVDGFGLVASGFLAVIIWSLVLVALTRLVIQ